MCFVADVPGGTARGAEAAAPQIRRLRRPKGRARATAAQMLLAVSSEPLPLSSPESFYFSYFFYSLFFFKRLR